MIRAHRETVGSGTPVLLATNREPRVVSVAVKNLTGSADVLIDGSDQGWDATQAFPWTQSTDGPLTITLDPGEALWAESAGADQICAVLEQNQEQS